MHSKKPQKQNADAQTVLSFARAGFCQCCQVGNGVIVRLLCNKHSITLFPIMLHTNSLCCLERNWKTQDKESFQDFLNKHNLFQYFHYLLQKNLHNWFGGLLRPIYRVVTDHTNGHFIIRNHNRTAAASCRRFCPNLYLCSHSQMGCELVSVGVGGVTWEGLLFGAIPPRR